MALLGLPIGHAMLGASILYLLLVGQDMSIAGEQMLRGLYGSYVLLAIPLFIFAADLMNVGTLSDRLLDFCRALVGRFRGGLGHVNVVSSLIFSGMSGSAIADAVGMGRIIINLMTKDGKYPAAYAGAITAASAIIGPIIPPSIPMVLYALVSDTSIGYLFLGGVGPGLILGVLLMVMNAIQARRYGFPVEDPVPVRELPRVTLRAVPGPADAGDPAGRHLRRRHHPDRGRGAGRALRLPRLDVLLPLGQPAHRLRTVRHSARSTACGRHPDRRRAGLQLRRHGRADPERHPRRAWPRPISARSASC